MLKRMKRFAKQCGEFFPFKDVLDYLSKTFITNGLEVSGPRDHVADPFLGLLLASVAGWIYTAQRQARRIRRWNARKKKSKSRKRSSSISCTGWGSLQRNDPPHDLHR